MRDERATRRRLYFVDNIRILLAILVILHHLAITYGAPGHWPYVEGPPDDLTSLLFTLFTTINQAFFLAFWYMISGYFTPRSYDRRGFGPFIVDRLLRLGIPLLFYIVVVDPLLVYALVVNLQGFQGSFVAFLPRYLENYSSLGVGPLWFIELLLVFTLLYALYRWLAARATRDQETRRAGQEDRPPDNAGVATFALLLGMVTFAWRIWMPEGSMLKPLGLPLAYLPQYAALFVASLVAYRRNWFLAISDASGRLWLWMAIVCIVVLLPALLVLGGALEGNVEPFTGGLYWQSLAFSVWQQFVCVGMIIGLLVLFRRRLDRQSGLARAMSASTYAVYIIHQPVLISLGLLLKGVELNLLLKFALVAPVAVALCFLLGYYVRKLPGVNKIL